MKFGAMAVPEGVVRVNLLGTLHKRPLDEPGRP